MSKFNTYIEICEMPEGELAGRTKIKMSACEIYPDKNHYNANGITWLKQYIEDNIASTIGAPYVVSWLDEELQIPSDHGTMSVDDEGNIEFDGVAVGSIQEAYTGTVNIDGIDKEALITEGYLYNQRYPLFVDWLKESLANGENIKGSIEINGKGANKNIEYLDGSTNEDGTLKVGRIPTVFDVSGLAILYMCNPSDNTSQVIEINQVIEDEKVLEDLQLDINTSIEQNTINIIIEDEVKEELSKQVKEKVIVKSKSFEINELSYDDIATIISRAFNAAMSMKEPNEYCYYYMYKFYPQSQTIIMTDYNTPSEYYKTTYNITNNDVTIGDIVEVDMAWMPSNDEPSVEVNSLLIKDILSKKKDKGGKEKMDEKQIAEINAKLDDLTAKLTDSDSKIVESNTKIDELNSTIAELNSTVVEANKNIEAKTTELNLVNEELNSLKAFKEAKDIEAKEAEAQAKIAEINTYFEVEIKKNGFSEVELNSLKTEYVEKNDMEGLKAKEAELCVKRVKELNSLKTNVDIELNAKNDNTDLFMAIHNTEKSEEDISDLF